MLIKTAIILNKKHNLDGRDIMHGVNSYTLSCREYKTDFLELNFDKIQKTLRVISWITIYSWSTRQ